MRPVSARTGWRRFISTLKPRKAATARIQPSVSQQCVHQPLDDPSRQIRLVRLYSPITDSEDELVKCSLSTVYLDQAPEYYALSYACGDPHDLVPVEVDGLQAMVYRNLEAALRQIGKLQDSSTSLWIDCLCINQSKSAEKSLQVALMSNIYRRAQATMAWLGEQDETSSAAFDIVQGVNRNYDAFKQWRGLRNTQSLSKDEITARTLQLRASVFDCMRPENDSFRPCNDDIIGAGQGEELAEVIGTRGIKAIIDLLLRPWWHRLWVRQEVSLAQSCLLICGNDVCNMWETENGIGLLRITDLIRCGDRAGITTLTQNSRINDLTFFLVNRELRQSAKNPRHWALLDVVMGHHAAECELGQDKIFALLGIATDDMVKLNAPDYTLSVEEVYERLARTSIETSQSLEILYIIHSSYISSWIPDWRLLVIESRIIQRPAGGQQARLYNASLDHAPRYGFLPTSSGTRPRVLEVGGFELDVVDQGGWQFPWDMDDAPIAAYIQKWKRLSFTAARLSEEDFWLLLTLDCDPRQRLTPEGRSDFLSTAQTWAQTGHQTDWPSEVFKQLVRNSKGMQFFTTKRNKFVAISDSLESAKRGDLVCILFGSQVPVILRPKDEHYERIGCCYIPGIMDGEALSMDIGAESNHRVFSII